MPLDDICTTCGWIPKEYEYRTLKNLKNMNTTPDDNLSGTLHQIGRCRCSEWVMEGDDWVWLQELPSIFD